MDKWFILKDQNWILSTCDSFPLIVSHICIWRTISDVLRPIASITTIVLLSLSLSQSGCYNKNPSFFQTMLSVSCKIPIAPSCLSCWILSCEYPRIPFSTSCVCSLSLGGGLQRLFSMLLYLTAGPTANREHTNLSLTFRLQMHMQSNTLIP